jgi:hypothetical protein
MQFLTHRHPANHASRLFDAWERPNVDRKFDSKKRSHLPPKRFSPNEANFLQAPQIQILARNSADSKKRSHFCAGVGRWSSGREYTGGITSHVSNYLIRKDKIGVTGILTEIEI